MKGMIWKECRENLQWMVFAMLAFGVASAYYQGSLGPTAYRPSGLLFAFAQWTTLGPQVCALALGFQCIYKEQRRDQTAFLLHRPITRTTIWAGKAVAGLACYLIATFVPFWIGVWWTAVPGHVAAPFEIGMSLTGAVEIFRGITYFFAGMLIAERPGRWYGSKAAPILAALVATWWGMPGAVNFSGALLAIILPACCFAIAAWGSFLSGGEFDSQPRAGKVILGAILYLGCACWVGGVIQTSQALEPASAPHEYKRWAFDTMGNPVVRHAIPINGKNGYFTTVYTDVNGRVTDSLEAVAECLSPTAHFRPPQLDVELIQTNDRLAPRQPWAALGGVWYFDAIDGHIYGYDAESRLPIATLGPRTLSLGAGMQTTGFADANDRFPKGSHLLFAYGSVLVAGATAYMLATDSPISGPLTIQSSSDEPITSVDGQVVGQNHRVYLIGTPSTIEIRDERGQLLGFAPYAAKRDGQMVGLVDNGRNIAILDTQATASVFTVYTATGQLVRREILPTMGNPMMIYRLFPLLHGLTEAPVAVACAYFTHFRYEYPVALFGRWVPQVAGDAHVLHLMVAIMSVSTLIALLLTWRITLRWGLGSLDSWPWLLAVAAFGPCMMLMLLCLRAFPARETCALCGKKRRVNRVHCEHCGADWPQTPKSGTEIFDEDSSTPVAWRSGATVGA